ncbi:MAG: isoaspartyl peptidase/L-asparaginase [Roseiflexus sp.]|uniref:isoaspartyl peptidase/L-asparaginase family protein n=1 Tax=Roseiflexus sp. TaxID=2562120 RepID=UPI0025F309BA|nr:isoaspartyl peptidase/L-asparaginase [Roseiflexus sp.]MCL6543351.1 isoaspartyl peptidase/L-asparaginase [Roseiflexus sp.]
MPLALIVHGGAWDIPDDEVAPHLAGCRRALAAGWEALTNGRSALDAVEIAVRIMEDDPTFDAGVGSVLNRDGLVELDAAIMDGATLRSGAVAAVRGIRNPISLARRVLESEAALLVGRGAERFADTVGIERCADEDMIVPRERARWEELHRLAAYRTPDAFQRPPGEVAGLRGIVAGGDHAPDQPGLRIQHPGDTVGAVALDRYGNLAAAVSTGGTPFKLPGRVGDTPLIGAGLYADGQTGGCASTGWGESIMKVLLAKTATDFLGAGYAPVEAARAAIERLEQRVHGLGGVILIDARGRVGYAFNTPRMAYAYRVEGGEEVAGV